MTAVLVVTGEVTALPCVGGSPALELPTSHVVRALGRGGLHIFAKSMSGIQETESVDQCVCLDNRGNSVNRVKLRKNVFSRATLAAICTL